MSLKINLKAKFRNAEYAHGYMESHSINRIGAQIQCLRKQRGWTQTELSSRANISQEKISVYENADFQSITFKTLTKLANAFDVHLAIGFCEFSKGIEDVANFSVDHLKVKSRIEDLENYEPEQEETVAISNMRHIPTVERRVQPRAVNLRAQTAMEVANDLMQGKNSNYYISEIPDNRPNVTGHKLIGSTAVMNPTDNPNAGYTVFNSMYVQR